MLTLAEYVAARAQLARIAQTIEETYTTQAEGKTKKEKLQLARDLAETYKGQVNHVIGTNIALTAQKSVDHYEKLLDIQHPDAAVADKIIDAQFEDKYYGATLTQRLTFNEQLLRRRITQSGAAGVLDSVYTGPKFGSQLATDQRLLLGTVAKIEQDVAKEFATLTEHQLMRWTLSHRHKQPDDCDALANNVDRRVEQYLREKNLDMDPRGLYFVDDLPVPPHPNCQCEYGVVGDTKVHHSSLDRAVHEVKKILRRLWGK